MKAMHGLDSIDKNEFFVLDWRSAVLTTPFIPSFTEITGKASLQDNLLRSKWL